MNKSPVKFPSKVAPWQRTAFTLVEMLIAVALVLLIMTMFAEIFQIAAGSLGKQRGIAENDQRGRMLDSIIRSDVSKRTFRNVIPFTSGQDTDQIAGGLESRSGYWYYAENNSGDDTDDVLCFTVNVQQNEQTPAGPPYQGLASAMIRIGITSEDTTLNQIFINGDYSTYIVKNCNVWISGSIDATGTLSNDGKYSVTNCTYNSMTSTTTVTVSTAIPYSLPTHGFLYIAETEPELDDGIPDNSVGESKYAEIAYFLRGGNLHRRVLLIRDSHGGNSQPHLADGERIINGNYTANTGTFWRDFDYSAFYHRGKLLSSNSLKGGGVYFHSNDSLSNGNNLTKLLMFDTLPASSTFVASDQYRPVSLGIPQFRFGHDGWTGMPVEFVGTNNFIGRYTVQECSHPAFGYPGFVNVVDPRNPDTDQSPMTVNYVSTLDSTTKAVGAFAFPQNRRGQDILMSNVVGFDVKVWDPTNSVFVDLGTGSFNTSNNIPYSPTNSMRYDTWHPSAFVIDAGGIRHPEPPFTTQLSAVQITVNYRDPPSGQLRQVTIVQSLIDPTN